eukprot:TRINITY_DN5503_c1_g1_i1.p1 TRINITY_DN5503_c1_g1~~TRINITY_DN5503_c1_g1_i1.p1  ORF type:complete len:371 (+),score=77.34 TRINITY_DN5503_c1_g1_i1:89-1201(+)
MELTKKKVRNLRRFLALVMFGLAIYTTVELTDGWLKEGRKEGKQIDVVELEGVYPPSLYFKPEAGDCGIVAYGCNIVINDTQTDCEDAMVEYGNHYCRLFNLTEPCSPRKYCQERAVNGTYAAVKAICSLIYKNVYIGFNNNFTTERGLAMRNSVDTLVIYFFMNERDCLNDAFTKSAQALLMFADRSYGKGNMLTALINGEDAVTAPIPVGLGHLAFINYNIEQEEFVNGTIINTTELQTTQYRRIVPPNASYENFMVSLDFKVSRFTAVRTIHTPGQTWIDLFGGIFGWWGVLTGACILTFFDTMNTMVEKINNKKEKDAKGNEQIQTDSDIVIVSEIPLLERDEPSFGKQSFATIASERNNISTTTV